MSAFDGLNEVFGTEPAEIEKAQEAKSELKRTDTPDIK